MSASLIFSIAVGGYDRFFYSCVETQKDYARRCGCEYVLIDDSPRPLRATEAAWLKIPLIRAALDNEYEWVAFIDADCDIRHNAPCFINTLNTVADRSLFMAPGHSGRINSGVIFARNEATSRELFDTIMANADQTVPDEDRAPYENGHVIRFAKNNPHLQLLDARLWNNNQTLDTDSYIQHYSAGALREWYINSRAPEDIRRRHHRHKSISSRISRRLSRYFSRSVVQPVLISSSMNELMPFYQEKYSAFRVPLPPP